MSNDFKKVYVKDDRLMVTDSLNYGVFKGGQNVTNVRFPAISSTPNNLNFVIPFPSESTVLDREVYLKTTTNYLITFPAALPGKPIYQQPVAPSNISIISGYNSPLIYGYNISVGSFPTQRTMDTIQVQINNNILTVNSADVFPALLRCADAIDWEKENMCSSAVDRLAQPVDEMALQLNNNMAGYDVCDGGKFVGNSAFNNLLTPVDSATPFNPNGTLNVFDYNAPAVGGVFPGLAGTSTFVLTVTSTEPLIAPPFIWNKTICNKQGIYGIQNLQIVCNYGNLAKAIKLSPFDGCNYLTQYLMTTGTYVPSVPTATPLSGPTVQLTNFFQAANANALDYGTILTNAGITVSQTISNAELQMKYITPHGTDINPVRNVIPLLEFPRFITSNNYEVGFATKDANGILTPSPSYQLASQTYTLNQVPDKLLIFVRPGPEFRNNSTYNDFVLPISNIVIQWNNHAGILANASQEQLFHMSKEAGSNQDYLAFSGHANAVFNRSSGMLGSAFQQGDVLHKILVVFIDV
jgi:hypothetical protein